MSVRLNVKPIRIASLHLANTTAAWAVKSLSGKPYYWGGQFDDTPPESARAGTIQSVTAKTDAFGVHLQLEVNCNAGNGTQLITALEEDKQRVIVEACFDTLHTLDETFYITVYQRGEYDRISPTNRGGYVLPRGSRGFYPTLCHRYHEILEDNKEIEGVDYNTKHLQWMLEELQYNREQTVTKKHRWLGFIQGVMIANGLITVEDERNLTRGIFNGA